LKYVIYFFLFLAIPLRAEVSVKVKVLRGYSRNPVGGATVISKAGKASGLTDKFGEVNLVFPKVGFFEIRVVSGERIESRNYEIRYAGQEILIYLSETSNSGIVVQGEKDKVVIGRYGLSQEEIKRLPGVAGDSLKALQTIPGIAIGVPLGLTPTVFSGAIGNFGGAPYTNSSRGDLTLRGGGARQNLFLFDGFLLPYAFHLGNQSSVLNNNIIKSFDVYTGAFPARYGFATGGIISIDGVDKVEETKSVININFFLADAYHQTKLISGLSMIAGVRQNYPNLVLLRVYPQGIPEDAKFAQYNDFQAKIFWDLNSDHKIVFQTFGSRDRQAYTKQVSSLDREGEDPRPPIGLDRIFRTDGLKYIWKGKKFRNTIAHSRTELNEFNEVRFTNPLTGENVFGLQNRTTDVFNFTEARLEVELIEEMLKWESGIQNRARDASLKGENISSRNRTFQTFFDNLLDSNATFRSLIDGDRVIYQELALYTEFQAKWNGFRFSPGVRLDSYSGSKEKNLSPRINGGYVFESTKTSILGGHGIHFNAPPSIEQLSTKSGNPNLLMEKSEHNTIGINQELPKGWNIKVEGFRNIFENIVVNDNYSRDAFAPNQDPRILVRDLSRGNYQPFVVRNLSYSNSGYGTSEGWELFLRKSKDPKESSGLFGWISYTNSLTKRINNQPRTNSSDVQRRDLENLTRRLVFQNQVGTNLFNIYEDGSSEIIFNNDRMELYDLDRTHILNMVFGYKFNPEWQLGGRFRYFSGNPYTPIVNAQRAGQTAAAGITLFIPEYSQNFNSDRFLPIHQIDIRLDRFISYDWGYWNWYVELVNFYGRRNQSGENFDNFRAFQRGVNPSPIFDTVNSPFIQTVRPGGNLVYLPLLNLGIEVRF